MHSYIIKTPLY